MDGKLDESLCTFDKQQPLRCKVFFETQERIIESIAKQIKKQLDNDTSSNYRRKPILVLCRKREEAETVFDELKRRLRDVTKIVLVADEQDFAD